MIVHAALLAPEPIPLFLFAEGREKFGEPLCQLLAGDGLDEALAALRAFALVDRETIPDERDPAIKTDTIRLHRLVREVAAARRTGDARDDVRRALITAVAIVYPLAYYNPGAWPQARRLDALTLDLVSEDAALPPGGELSAFLLIHKFAIYRDSALGAYTQAEPLYQRALALCDKLLGPMHPFTATILNNLACLLRDRGDYAPARPLFERALTIREKLLGPEDPLTAMSLDNLARLLREQGDLDSALPLCKRALAIHEKVLGREHPDTATNLGNLAALYELQGEFTAARPPLERALAIREKVLGPEHPNTALSLANLAFLLECQGKLSAAQPLYQRALAINESVFGRDHPDVARVLSNLARLLGKHGDLGGAQSLYERALAIFEKVLGPKHPSAVAAREDLASLTARGGMQRPGHRSSWPGTPRNAPCPCGSGKKFKRCHGGT